VFALSPGTHQADLNGTPTLITNVIAESGDWSFVSAVPLRTVTRGLRRVQRVTLFVILTILAVGVAAAALIGYRLLQPVRFLSENKEALERELEAQNPLLISSFFEKLLRGEFAAESEIEAYMSHLVLDLHMRWYCVAMASLSEAGTLSMWGAAGDQKANRLILSDAVRRTSDSDSVYVHNVDTHRLAVIVGGETESYADARKRAREIIERGMRAVPVPIARLCSWGVGTPYRALIEIFHSAREASLTLDYGEMHERGGVVFYEDIPRRRSGYSYPPEVENRVMSLARSGGVDELKSVLDGLQQENIDSRHPSSLAVRLFADNLLCTVMKLLDTNVIKEEAPAATTEQQIEAAAEELSPHRRHCLARKLLLEVAEATNCRKQSHNSTLAQQIVHYVHQYFADPNLTRTSIADKFGISEPYLSQFFKEQTGETLGTYIQGLRMKQARKLLADPKTPVKDVYQNVGYSAYTTFARAFKRVYGISATNYRESLERAT
jgi:AraC-like DNA-binding protein